MRIFKLLSVVFALVFVGAIGLYSCDGADDGHWDPTKAPSTQQQGQAATMNDVMSGQATGEVSDTNVSSLVGDLVSVGALAAGAAGSCADIEGSLDSAQSCPDGGSVTIENCTSSGDQMSYDVVFNNCTTSDPAVGNVVMDGKIEVDASGNFVDVTYDYTITVMGYVTTVNMTMNMYVTPDGGTISYTINQNNVTIDGVDSGGVSCRATVTVDTSAQTWTSDGGCGLPTGPISF